MKYLHTLTLSALCAAPTFAQETEAKAQETKAVSPAIQMWTADGMVSAGFHRRYAPDGQLPDLGEGEYYAMTVTSDGKLVAKTMQGAVGYFKLRIHPGPMLELHKDLVEENWETIRDGAALGLTQLGISAKQAAIMMRAVRQFPLQIESLDISVSQDPSTQVKGLKLDVDIMPKADTWLGKMMQTLKPSSQGVPVLPKPAKNAKPMIDMQAAINPTGLDVYWQPILEVLSHVGARNKKERTLNLGMLTKMMNAQDGTFASAGDPFGGSYFGVLGLRDATLMNDLMTDDGYARFTELIGKANPAMEIEMEPAAFKHREATVTKTTIITEIDTPTMPAGEQISYAAVAGSYLVTTTGDKPEAAKKLIDTALDQKFPRRPLAGGLLMSMHIQLIDMLDKISPFGNPFAGEQDGPETLTVTASKKGPGLNVRIAIQ